MDFRSGPKTSMFSFKKTEPQACFKIRDEPADGGLRDPYGFRRLRHRAIRHYGTKGSSRRKFKANLITFGYGFGRKFEY